MTPAERKFLVFRFCRFLCWVHLKLWHRFETRGEKNVPAEGGCIVVANHASFLDPPAVGCGPMFRMMRFMARDTLYKKGFIKWLFLRFGTVPLSREKGDIAALKKALQVLRDGGCVGIFPEGTRTMDGNLQPAKSGIGFLIGKAGVPVIPAYIDGTFAAYPRGAKFIRPAKIRVIYGPPIQSADLAGLGEGRDRYEKIAALIMERIASLRDELRNRLQ